MNLTLPHHWTPRDYQLPFWHALENGKKRACVVWHRRAGKDLFCINWFAVQAMQRVGLYWHILPTYRQGRKVVWEGKTREGRSFLSHIPEELIIRKRDDEMTLWLANGSMYQVIGGEDPDRLVGANPVGVVFSEWPLMPARCWEYIRPILAENGGWAAFIYTPRGRNHGWRTLQTAKKNPDTWFSEKLGVDDTQAVTADAIQEEREAGMPEELIQQEFHVSFDAPLVGSFFGDQVNEMGKTDRIGEVPWEPACPVTTAWDLGIADSTCIWFCQQVGHEIRLIDFYHSSGVGLDHYAKVLAAKPYAYKEHLAPHDATVRELGTGQSRVESARKMGLRMRVVPKLALADGISAVRLMLPKVWADAKKCEYGLQALREYTKEQVLGERDPDGRAIFRDKPLHNWASHPCDALRTLAVGMRPKRRPVDQLAPRLAIV